MQWCARVHRIDHRRRRGGTLVYATILMSVMLLMASLAVDMGRVQLAKTQLQNAADAAARYGVSGMIDSTSSQTTAQSHASAVITDWKIEGVAMDGSTLTTTIGTFDQPSKTFTATNVSPNAVRIDLTYTFDLGGGKMPLFLHAVRSSMAPTIHASAVALATTNQKQLSPPASGNLWLAGMASGTQNQNFRPDANWVWDYAGDTSNARQSPLEVPTTGLNVNPGDNLSFEGLSGSATYDGSSSNNADGDPNFIVSLGQTYPGSVPTNNMNGIANTRAPIGAIMAVFMDDNAPTGTAAPAPLDFNDPAQRDYATLSPKLKQVFFVGDGKRTNGEVQHIVVPTGATRVFIGMMDAWQWNDNVGNFQFKVYGRNVITTVR